MADSPPTLKRWATVAGPFGTVVRPAFQILANGREPVHAGSRISWFESLREVTASTARSLPVAHEAYGDHRTRLLNPDQVGTARSPSNSEQKSSNGVPGGRALPFMRWLQIP